jgi:RHS repeat-associated protein
VREAFAYDDVGHLRQWREDGGRSLKLEAGSHGLHLRQATADEAGLRQQIVGDRRYWFDRAGYVVARDGPAGREAFEWDGFGRLRAASFPSGERVTFSYDALGRRITKDAEGRRVQFFWDADTVLAERRIEQSPRDDNANGSRRIFLFRPGTFEPLAMVGSDVAFIETDHAGIAHDAVTSSGSILWSARYDGLGRTETKGYCPLRFAGQYSDEETGLSYNRFRYFDPQLNAYLSPDPLGIAAGHDVYSYAPNVWTWNDPLGLAQKKCGGGKKVYRQLSDVDRENFDAGLDLQPRGEGGSIVQHVQGQPTRHISASETIEATDIFDSGKGLVEIDVEEATKEGTRFIDHNNVMQAVTRHGTLTDRRNARRSEEVLFRGPIPRSAMRLLS